MSYFGVIVLARSDRSITAVSAIDHFGLAQQMLRALGGGWQLLETGPSASYSREFEAGVRGWVDDARDGILAIDITDSCASVLAAGPEIPDVAFHFPETDVNCAVFQHAHHLEPATAEDAARRLTRFAESVGLEPNPAHLAWVLDPDRQTDRAYILTSDLVFELVLALGFPAITPSRIPNIDRSAAPFATIAAKSAGLASVAWTIRRRREPGDSEPDWVKAAITLEERICRSAFADEQDVRIAELLREIDLVTAAHRAYREAAGAPQRSIVRGRSEVITATYLADSMHTMLAMGNIISMRDWYDDRPEQHPIFQPHD
jgi:hypothetical protein